jgi:membrane protease YdiL (CAAX protease family)
MASATIIIVALAFTLAMIVTIAALLEEVRWRGYALPKLLAQHSALPASLIIGVCGDRCTWRCSCRV